MTPTTANLIGRKSNHSIMRVDDSLGFNNYVIVNEDTKDYYNVSIAKNTTIKESIESNIFYTIKKNNSKVNEDIYTVLPSIVIDAMINEVEDYVDQSNSEEVIDYMVDVLDSLGYKPRHVIYHDTVKETLDYEFVVIISGEIDTVYLSIDKGSDVYLVDEYGERNLLGNMSDPDIVKLTMGGHIESKEHLTGVYNDSIYEDAIREAFNQNYGFVFEDGFTKIYNRDNLTPLGYISRKNSTFKLDEEVEYFGIERVREYAEQSEVNQLLTESTSLNGLKAFNDLFIDRDIKISTNNFTGIVRITGTKEVMNQWRGEDYPKLILDITISRIDSLNKNEITTTSNQLIDALNKMTDGKSDLVKSIMSKVMYEFIAHFRNQFKYFGIDNLNPEIGEISF